MTTEYYGQLPSGRVLCAKNYDGIEFVGMCYGDAFATPDECRLQALGDVDIKIARYRAAKNAKRVSKADCPELIGRLIKTALEIRNSNVEFEIEYENIPKAISGYLTMTTEFFIEFPDKNIDAAHDAFLAWAVDSGWTHGEFTEEDKKHPFIRPFENLPDRLRTILMYLKILTNNLV